MGFTHEWAPPFMPHDAEMRWRWLDLEYKRHPWMHKSREVCAAADTPPILPPKGWVLDMAGWEVIPPDSDKVDLADAFSVGLWDCGFPGHKNVENDGWQYAHDLYISSMFYFDSPGGLLYCRRRRWRGTFVKALEEITDQVPKRRVHSGTTSTMSCWPCGPSPKRLLSCFLRPRWPNLAVD